MSQKIKLTEAKDLYEAFLDNKRGLLLQSLEDNAVAAGQLASEVNESKHGYISLLELKSYIAEIEAKGAARGYAANELGFHMYFGAYSHTHTSSPNQLTSLFVPTLVHSTGTKNDIVFTDDNGTLGVKKIKDVMDVDVDHEESSILNRLTLCPPPKVNTDLDSLIQNLN